MIAKIAVPLVLVLLLAGCGAKPDKAPDDKRTPARSIPAVDEEYRDAASHKGDRAQAVAKMMIENRRDDRWTWEQIKDAYGDEIAGTQLKDEFAKWRQARIEAGDKAK